MVKSRMVRSPVAQASCLLALALATACNRRPPPDYSAPPPAPAPTAPGSAPASAPAAKAAAPEYSPAKAAELITELSACEYDFKCPAYKPVVSFGDKVSKDLLAVALDASKKGHRVAIQALAEIKDPSVALPMFQAAQKTKDIMDRIELGKAAGKIGGDDLFNYATKLYSEKISSEQGDLIERALAGSGERASDWALGKLPSSTKVVASCTLANVVRETTAKRPDALAKIQAVIPKTKQVMARHRLAVAAIALGDVQQFDTLAAGIKDGKDDLNRSDASNMLSNVIEKLPPARKDEFIQLLEAAQKKGKGHIEERGINESLKKLKT